MDELLKLLLGKGFDVTPVFDGAYHRFHRGGKDYAGWFRGWEIRDAHDQVLCQEAEFGDWVTREKHKWTGGLAQSNMTPEQLAELNAKRLEAIEAAKAEKLQRQVWAARDASRLYESARTFKVEAHPYIVRKGIRPGGLERVLADKLVIPVMVPQEGITSLQLIAEDGSKKFLSGGRLDGCISWWLPTGNKIDFWPDTIYMAEGYATAASVGMAMRCPVLIAFNTGNMVKVAHQLARVRRPVVICADNDGGTKGNPGMRAAHEARDVLVRQGIECTIRAPQASEGTSCDWNDFHVANGLEAVRKALTGEVKPPDNDKKSEVPPVHTHTLTAQLPALSSFQPVKVRVNEKGKPIPPTQKQVVDQLLEGLGDILLREEEDIFLRTPTHWAAQNRRTFRNFIKRAGMRILHNTATDGQLKDIYNLFLSYVPSVPEGQSFYRQDPRLSNFLDGTLELTRQEDGKYKMHFREHRPEDLLTWVLPYEYKSAGGHNELFSSWLLRCFEGDPDANGKVRALKQIGGACLASLFPRYVFLYGVAGTGKSTFAKLCLRFLSPQNVCSVEPKRQNARFGGEIMINKLANIVTDISGAVVDPAMFKRGEDRVPEYIDRKGIGAVMGFLPALNVYCTNIFPKGIDGETAAMDRRVSIVHFLKVLTKDGYTRDYELNLLRGGPGAILQFFLEGLEDLCESGGIYFNPESGAARLKDWKDSESLSAQFIEAVAHGEIEGLMLDAGSQVPRKLVNDRLVEWTGKKLSNQAVCHVFADLEARGFTRKRDSAGRYVQGFGVSVSHSDTRF